MESKGRGILAEDEFSIIFCTFLINRMGYK